MSLSLFCWPTRGECHEEVCRHHRVSVDRSCRGIGASVVDDKRGGVGDTDRSGVALAERSAERGAHPGEPAKRRRSGGRKMYGVTRTKSRGKHHWLVRHARRTRHVCMVYHDVWRLYWNIGRIVH